MAPSSIHFQNPALVLLQKFTLHLPWKFDRVGTAWVWVNDDLRNSWSISLRILNATHNIYHEVQLSRFLENCRIMKFLQVWIGDNKELRLSFEREKEALAHRKLSWERNIKGCFGLHVSTLRRYNMCLYSDNAQTTKAKIITVWVCERQKAGMRECSSVCVSVGVKMKETNAFNC